MPILFENVYARDESTIKKLFGYLLFWRPACVILHGAMCLIALLDIALTIWEGWTLEGVFYLLFFALYAVMRFIQYRKNVNILLERDRELFRSEGAPTVCIRAFDDRLEGLSPGQAVQTVYWAEVNKVFVSEDFIILRSRAHLLYILKNDAFTYGDKENFLNFLVSKGLKV